VPFDPHQLARVVAEQTHRADAQLAQDLDTHSVIALIRFEAEPLVGLDRVEALVLELVRANLVREPDAAAFLIQIQQDAAAFLGNPLHGRIELGAAVTADRVQSVAGQARRVDADEDVRAIVPSSFITSQMTPAGYSPAIRAMSTDASVCPVRASTPPVRERSGNMCPGRSRSEGRVAGSMAASTVAARSAAEMPVLVRSFA